MSTSSQYVQRQTTTRHSQHDTFNGVRPTSRAQLLSHSGVGTMGITTLPFALQSPNGDRYIITTIVGNGSFGIVMGGHCDEENKEKDKEGKEIAVKRVLQDKRYKNRELSILSTLAHPNIVELKNSFFSTVPTKTQNGIVDELYLNLVLEFVPETIYKSTRDFVRKKQNVPTLLVKLYTYQLARALCYIHAKGICHRDIKPQNLLVDPSSAVVKLCDFGSAKHLVKGEPNISYICSRYYRAPELILAATEYTTAIDIWSLGCVMAEMMLGLPLFPGNSGIDQMVEIIQILGTPSVEQLYAMSPKYPTSNFPIISSRPWKSVFRSSTSPEALDLLSNVLTYNPTERLTAVQVMAHPFFDDLRKYATSTDIIVLPSKKPYPRLLDFTSEEIEQANKFGVLDKLLGKDLVPFQKIFATSTTNNQNQ